MLSPEMNNTTIIVSQSIRCVGLEYICVIIFLNKYRHGILFDLHEEYKQVHTYM